MSANPFDDSEARFLVLTNEHDQHSLWPATVTVPAGWSVALAESARDECVRYVERNWTDLRPRGASPMSELASESSSSASLACRHRSEAEVAA
ncbi:MbtH protein [Actinoplanes campanulatus]|uniref:MbtH protein n=1 Tax=Actinoplanes campanulatus TaxID=113559 RepID=A0A7W5ABU5_9ACTN|nr:MbtH family protein [Actinoplanes campanulatus]MBB3093406.1 MbtH protein [Actinoplanes campanulatus]GGN03398.1 hypothetical protein GCM10010109_09660 [Actinoplanes campanulatus]GID33500.1 hypothetical protein Aca09nite_00060 [Actinoplanes campanulatus]